MAKLLVGSINMLVQLQSYACASETAFGSIPALDCETEVLNQVSLNNVLKACVAGSRVSELTVTNNSS